MSIVGVRAPTAVPFRCFAQSVSLFRSDALTTNAERVMYPEGFLPGCRGSISEAPPKKGPSVATLFLSLCPYLISKPKATQVSHYRTQSPGHPEECRDPLPSERYIMEGVIPHYFLLLQEIHFKSFLSLRHELNPNIQLTHACVPAFPGVFI